jgi:hypothetical protein
MGGGGNIQVKGTISLTSNEARVFGISVDGGITWMGADAIRINPWIVKISDLITTSQLASIFVQLQTSNHVLAVEPMVIQLRNDPDREYVAMKVKIALVGGGSEVYTIWVKLASGEVSVSYGMVQLIDPRNVANWYAEARSALIKDFFTWLGWNRANPSDYTTLSAQPNVVNFIRFLAGWGAPTAP